MNDSLMISVIIPVYNSEAYLDRCLDSLRRQTYQNLELILVNDGSTDGSEEVCRKHEGQDDRIRLINQENRGSAAARNTGLRHAKGELIGFVDSDDRIHPEMYEKLFRKMKETDADIALCDVEKNGRPEHPDWTDGTFRGKGAIFTEYIHDRVINRVYNKLYRADIVRGVDFPEGRNMMEDASWTPRALEKAECITRLAKPLYYYTDNEKGLTRSKTSHTKTCSRFANLLDLETVCLRNADNEPDRRMKARELIGYIRQMMESSDDLELFQIRQKLKDVIAENRQILTTVSDRDERMMLDAILTRELLSARKEYRRAVWLYGSSVKARLRLARKLLSQRIGNK